MKDTFLIGTFVAVVVGFWFYLQKTDFGGLPSGQLQTSSFGSTTTAQDSKPVSLPHSSHPRSKHESRNQDDDSTTPFSGAVEADSGRVAEVEGIHSIYAGKSVEAHSVGKKRSSRKARAVPNTASKATKNNQRKYVHGVPVDQWLEWNKNRLRLGEVAAPSAEGLRLFVQCMEMKQGGPKSVAQSECIKLTAKTPKLTPNTY
jgi:hypothetical protein